jgi:hypothetical protein
MLRPLAGRGGISSIDFAISDMRSASHWCFTASKSTLDSSASAESSSLKNDGVG